MDTNKKFKIKYTKQNGEEVRRFGIITDTCRGIGKRKKDNRHFYIIGILKNKDTDTQPIRRYYNGQKRNKKNGRWPFTKMAAL